MRIMLIGTENGIRRCQMDIEKQLAGCTPQQRQRVKQNLRIFIPQSAEDRDLSLHDPVNCERIRRAVLAFNPDLIVFDPYGDFFAGANENDAVQTRITIKTLMNVAQAANPQTAVIVVHHARSGQSAAAGADGWDRGAYARGSKALLSIARAQINIAPGDKDGKSLVIACGKNNNGPKFETFGVTLNPKTMRYEHNPDFNRDHWTDEVSDKKPKSGPKKAIPDSLLTYLLRGGKTLTRKQFVQSVMEAAARSESTAERAIDDAVERQVIAKGNGYYCLPQRVPTDE